MKGMTNGDVTDLESEIAVVAGSLEQIATLVAALRAGGGGIPESDLDVVRAAIVVGCRADEILA